MPPLDRFLLNEGQKIAPEWNELTDSEISLFLWPNCAKIFAPKSNHFSQCISITLRADGLYESFATSRKTRIVNMVFSRTYQFIRPSECLLAFVSILKTSERLSRQSLVVFEKVEKSWKSRFLSACIGPSPAKFSAQMNRIEAFPIPLDRVWPNQGSDKFLANSCLWGARC